MGKAVATNKSSDLSIDEARRVVLHAQGFHGVRSTKPVSRRKLSDSIQRLGVLQIDSVNILARAHTLPTFSRIGHYRENDLFDLAYSDRHRALFEYWGHAASLLPLDLYPLLRWRMTRAEQGTGIYTGLARFGRERAELIQQVRREITDRGPLSAAELTLSNNRSGGWWGWSDGKTALEWLFWAGIVTTATRRSTFERVYDLTQRVLPPAVLNAKAPDECESHRQLVGRSAIALGVATESCIRDYYRLAAKETRVAIGELTDAGELIRVQVDGWRKPAFMHHTNKVPRSGSGKNAAALLAPFDPLIWHRDRAEFLFGAQIRLEIYTPAEKRKYGYYVLPFLLGDRVVARVDLKADRQNETLCVLATHAESGVAPKTFVSELAKELNLLAHWLGLPKVQVTQKGNAARALRAEIGQSR
ncbi:winged helix-turn-helix domain-containing protein [Stieleria varia]|nr:crosslink repair DNA glycosylase YcaQ family protein [Stieleria varia]